MNDVSREYAEAVFAIAKENKDTDTALDDLTRVHTVLCENPDYRILLTSLAIPAEERAAVIKEAFSGHVSDYVLDFLCLFCERNRMEYYDEFLECFKGLYMFDKNITEVTVKSSRELSNAQKKRLEAKLKEVFCGDISPVYLIDKNLIGGITVETDGKVIDGSIKTRLRGIKEVIGR